MIDFSTKESKTSDLQKDFEMKGYGMIKKLLNHAAEDAINMTLDRHKE